MPQLEKRKVRTAAAVLTALTVLAAGKKARGQAVGNREPLFPVLGAASATFPRTTALTYASQGARGSRSFEQDVFVPLGERSTGHFFAGANREGRPTWLQLGLAHQFAPAVAGDVTMIIPASGRHLFAPGLRVSLQRAGLTLKFAPAVDSSGRATVNGVVIKGFDLSRLHPGLNAALRGSGNTERRFDLAAALGGRTWVLDLGARRLPNSEVFGRARIAVGSRRFYGAAAGEFPLSRRGREPMFTFSFGGEFGSGRQSTARESRVRPRNRR